MTRRPEPDQACLHESYLREDAAVSGSDRAFGILFAIVFAIVACWPLLSGGRARLWALGFSAAFLLLATFRPHTLRHGNALWHRLGTAMHRIVSPLVLGILFFCSVVPTGLIMRALGKDPLRLRFDREAGSYWIRREPPGPAPDSMRNQF